MAKTQIGIILGSARLGSLGEHIFKYLQTTFVNNDEYEYNWIRLADYPLDFYEHSETPLSQPITDLTNVESAWLTQIKAQDGYVILTPEYDHSITGALKNALDYIGPEVDHKPVQLIAYSSYSDGGMLAAQSVVQVLQMLKMIVLPTPTLLWNANDNFDATGKLIADAPNSTYFAQRLAETFSEIGFYTALLKAHPRHPD